MIITIYSFAENRGNNSEQRNQYSRIIQLLKSVLAPVSAFHSEAAAAFLTADILVHALGGHGDSIYGHVKGIITDSRDSKGDLRTSTTFLVHGYPIQTYTNIGIYFLPYNGSVKKVKAGMEDLGSPAVSRSNLSYVEMKDAIENKNQHEMNEVWISYEGLQAIQGVWIKTSRGSPAFKARQLQRSLYQSALILEMLFREGMNLGFEIIIIDNEGKRSTAKPDPKKIADELHLKESELSAATEEKTAEFNLVRQFLSRMELESLRKRKAQDDVPASA